MQCADEDGRHAKVIERREIVPGASSLTTCDELREAGNEIKRVPGNSTGSARSNYLHEVRTDIFSPSFLYFSIGPEFSPFHFLRRICRAIRDGQPEGRERSEQRKLFWITFFCARLWRAIPGKTSETRGQRDMELAELNTAHKLQREGPSWSETDGGQEFNFISQ